MDSLRSVWLDCCWYARLGDRGIPYAFNPSVIRLMISKLLRSVLIRIYPLMFGSWFVCIGPLFLFSTNMIVMLSFATDCD
jgi:hypothetical protein